MSSIDRLSSLPDAALCHILSFLPTKLSVATSILARRWRFLWARVPNIDFNSENHNTKTSFPHIINRVMLLLHKVHTINTFRLSYLQNCGEYELETWLATAIARDVQKLDLHLSYHVTLPKCLFTCKTLVDLRLKSCAGIPITGAVYLPCLKKLHLYSVKLNVKETLPRLLSGCPVLEELMIEISIDLDLVCYNISSLTIKRLILNCQLVSYKCYRPNYTVKINTPALRYLQLEDCLFKHVSVRMIASLTEADICINNSKLMGEDTEDDCYTHFVLDFVDSLCKVKCLKFSTGKMAFNNRAFQSKSITRFDNLTKLELTADWPFLTKFLENADNLEVLIVREVEVHLKYWMEPKQVPKSLSTHLRSVRIYQMRCTEHEFKMVRYILKNAKVLRRMEIYSQDHGIV